MFCQSTSAKRNIEGRLSEICVGCRNYCCAAVESCSRKFVDVENVAVKRRCRTCRVLDEGDVILGRIQGYFLRQRRESRGCIIPRPIPRPNEFEDVSNQHTRPSDADNPTTHDEQSGARVPTMRLYLIDLGPLELLKALSPLV